MLLAVFAYHVLLEFSELAPSDVDHLVVRFLLRRIIIALILVIPIFFDLCVRGLLGDGPIRQTWRLNFFTVQLFYVVVVLFVEDLWVLTVFRLVLIHFQRCHLLLHLFFLFLLFLFGLLLVTQLLEHVLTVQKGVGKLLFEILFVQELLDSRVNHRILKNLVDVWPFRSVQVQQGGDEVPRLLAEMGRDIRIFTLEDLFGELMERLRVEWWMKGAHFEEQNAEGPNVGLEAIWLILNDLRCEVVRRTNDRLCLRLGVTQDSCDTEISELDHVALRQENVLRLQVSVQYLAIMDVLERKTYLSEPVEHMVFAKVL